MKVCLHSSKVVQNSFRFDELFDKNLKILISQLYIFFSKNVFHPKLVGTHPVYKYHQYSLNFITLYLFFHMT